MKMRRRYQLLVLRVLTWIGLLTDEEFARIEARPRQAEILAFSLCCIIAVGVALGWAVQLVAEEKAVAALALASIAFTLFTNVLLLHRLSTVRRRTTDRRLMDRDRIEDGSPKDRTPPHSVESLQKR